jgi:predicted dehydrogenase
MGTQHYRTVQKQTVQRVEVRAVCDLDPSRLTEVDPQIPKFQDSAELIRSGLVDAVLIATPHYDHTSIGIDALEQGLHLLVEKPISVHKRDCLRLIEAYEQRPKSEQVFCAMFNQRTDPRYQQIRDMIRNDELGVLRRMNWIITDWFRTDIYYRSGGWRATWKGEGGGVLLNQCPHQLDLLWWLFGPPESVWAQCRFGQWHDVEVEDDVTALLTYANGATCSFITTTGETPGTNRLEIVGDKGTVIADESGLKWLRNDVAIQEYCRTSDKPFGKPEVTETQIPIAGKGGQHPEILQNFIDAVLDQAPLLAPAEEGLHSVELANAMLLSTFEGQPVSYPLDPEQFWKHLEHKISTSTYLKEAVKVSVNAADMNNSY